MSRITQIFKTLEKQQKKAFIPFLTAGDNGLDFSLELLHTYAQNGAEIIEIGVPFSDPMADGPVIASSHERAVASKISLHNVFTLVQKFRQSNTKVAIVLMGYLNPVEIYGYENFAKDCSKFGVDGVLIVDNPPEEAQNLKQLLDKNSVDLIFLIAPTTTDERIKYLKNLVSGFVYFVSLKGITGSNNIDTELVNANLTRIKKYIDLPICVGFGVKDAQTAKLVSQNSEGVIVATSFVAFIAKNAPDNKLILNNIGNLAKEINEVLQ